MEKMVDVHPRLKTILENDRFFDVQFSKLIEQNEINNNILEILINHFVNYIEYFNLSDQEICKIHLEFLTEYRTHLKEFEKSNTYPFQSNIKIFKERINYDISLLCSSFLTYQRYKIVETLFNNINIHEHQNVLSVGIGPAIEIAALQNKTKNIYAYDTSISEFVKNTFSDFQFFEKEFTYESNKLYDYILLIEILEHLENPFQLLYFSMQSLKPDGRIHFTTAVNVPQFDHLYNFDLNDKEIENCLLNNNFEIELKLNIPHNYSLNVEAFSCYYIIKPKKK
jgi:hypothetical protein